MRIGLTLSGGGFRACVFHLGVLARLAEDNMLEQVELVSTVSGGSLCGALVYTANGFVWPTSAQFVERVLPKARALLTTSGLSDGLIEMAIHDPLSVLDHHANTLSALLQERWGVTASLRAIPKSPLWMINATCYETTKNWRFVPYRMGDYVFGYTNDTDIPLSHAVAASSGFPFLIGPLVLDTTKYKWFKYRAGETAAGETAEVEAENKTEPTTPAFPVVHLWDGGVYDNFGMEGVFDFDTGWRHNLDYLIISDAAGRALPEEYHPLPRSALRLVTIMMDQVRSLRARAVVERMRDATFPGAYLRIGNTCEAVLGGTAHKDEIAQLSTLCLPGGEATVAANTASEIDRMSDADFERLFRHGHEVADYTLYAYYPQATKFFGYTASRWTPGTAPSNQPATVL